jgi:uncharacterized membrane protein YphA (DoxX/SURF4 family)
MASSTVGPSIAPLFLRLALGITFLMAGLGKVATKMHVEPEQAAVLANMGLIQAPPAAPLPADTPPADTPPAENPAESAPPVAPNRPVPAEPLPPSEEGPGSSAMVPVGLQVTVRTYSADDFPAGADVQPLNLLALSLKEYSEGVKADGTKGTRLWFPWAGGGKWPLYQAWAVTLTEIIGGVCVLLGLFTRLAGFGLFVVMAGALWLTQIGPAIQSGNTSLGFLPNHDLLDMQSWQHFLWQFTLGMGALALTFLGSGALGLDRALFPGAAPPPPKPKSDSI